MRKSYLLIIKLTISLSLIAFIYRATPLAQIADLFLQINGWYLLPITILLFSNTVISARKWQLFLRADDVNLSLWELTISYMSGTFCNLFLPSNIGGDSYRIYDIAKQSNQAVRSAASVFADRLSGFVALVVLSFLSSIVVSFVFGSPQFLIIPSILLLVFCGIVLILARQEPVRKFMAVTRLNRFGAVDRVSEKLFVSFARYGQNTQLLGRVMALSFMFQLSAIVVVFLMGRALGAETPLYYFGAFVPDIMLMEALPISIYGIGVRDYGYVYFFSQVGMGDLQTRSLALFFMAMSVCYSLIGGLFFLYKLWAGKKTGKPIPADRPS